MIKRHKDELKIMKSRLKEIGFNLEKEDDYSGTFENGTNWQIVFTTEPYYEGYNIWVRKKDSENSDIRRIGFSIFFLIGNILTNPSFMFNDILNFIIEYKDKIFDETFPYKEKYDELNKIPY